MKVILFIKTNISVIIANTNRLIDWNRVGRTKQINPLPPRRELIC